MTPLRGDRITASLKMRKAAPSKGKQANMTKEIETRQDPALPAHLVINEALNTLLPEAIAKLIRGNAPSLPGIEIHDYYHEN